MTPAEIARATIIAELREVQDGSGTSYLLAAVDDYATAVAAAAVAAERERIDAWFAQQSYTTLMPSRTYTAYEVERIVRNSAQHIAAAIRARSAEEPAEAPEPRIGTQERRDWQDAKNSRFNKAVLDSLPMRARSAEQEKQ